MTPLLHTAVLVAASSSKSSKKGGSSYFPLLIIAAIAIGAYFLFIRPRNKARRDQMTQKQTLEVGSEVMSVGGIMGTIVGMTDTTFDVAVADGVTMTFIRRAINPRPAGSGGTETTDTSDMPADPWDDPPDDLDNEGSEEAGVDLGKHEDDEDDEGGDRPERT